jgi:ABC-type Mn2+/Zn2+ transport system ATPase subunit
MSLVSCRQLRAGYGNGAVIEGVTFAVEPGARVAVLGPNGGGKTTLFRVLTGELERLGGELELGAGHASVPQTDRSRLDFPVSAHDVALMGSLDSLPWWRPPGRAERRRASDALAEVGMGEHIAEPFGELSGGQRQRVLIARALVQDAGLLLLDEPFSGLDSPSSEGLLALIDRLAASGKAILIATHDLEQARGWDQVLCLNRRQIAFGAPGHTLDRETLEATYGGEIVELPGDAGECVLPPHHHDDHDHAHSHD